jgi:hypothetical protein
MMGLTRPAEESGQCATGPTWPVEESGRQAQPDRQRRAGGTLWARPHRGQTMCSGIDSAGTGTMGGAGRDDCWRWLAVESGGCLRWRAAVAMEGGGGGQ